MFWMTYLIDSALENRRGLALIELCWVFSFQMSGYTPAFLKSETKYYDVKSSERIAILC